MTTTFIGMGHSPDGIDLPLGLSMELSKHSRATEVFGKMTNEQKHAAICYIQSATTGNDAKCRIKHAISQMENGQTTIC